MPKIYLVLRENLPSGSLDIIQAYHDEDNAYDFVFQMNALPYAGKLFVYRVEEVEIQ